jgi:hypothetical protein
MSNAANTVVRFESFRVFEDASGIVGTLRVGGFRFSFNWLGQEPRLHNLSLSGSARGSRAAARRAEKAVQERVFAETTEGWRVACAEMYDVDVVGVTKHVGKRPRLISACKSFKIGLESSYEHLRNRATRESARVLLRC